MAQFVVNSTSIETSSALSKKEKSLFLKYKDRLYGMVQKSVIY